MNPLPNTGLAASACLGAILADAHLGLQLLPPVTDGEAQAIAALFDPVVEEAREWCDQWTVFNRETILPLALLSCVQFPHLSIRQVALRVKSSVWVYALDDLIDDCGPTDPEMPTVLQQCLAVARTGQGPSFEHELARSLLGLRDDLATQPLWRAVFPAWVTSLELLLDGMMKEHRVRQQLRASGVLSEPLTIEEYLGFASHSIGLPHQWITGLAMEPDPLVAGAVQHFVALAQQCGRVMRLANDVATWRREETEGGVNAVKLERWRLPPAIPEAVATGLARRHVQLRQAEELQACHYQTASFSSARPVAHRFVRATEFGADLYARHDLRTWAHALEQALGAGEASAGRAQARQAVPLRPERALGAAADGPGAPP